MRVLVGLTNLCPTEEDISVIPIVYPLVLDDWIDDNFMDPDAEEHVPGHFEVTTVTHDDQLRRWAYRNFEIHRMVDFDEKGET